MDKTLSTNHKITGVYMKQYQLLKSLLFFILLYSIWPLFMSCNKELVEINYSATETNATSFNSGQSQNYLSAKTTYPFLFEASGPFTISAVSATVVKIDQELFVISASPFPLIHGFVRGFDDLTIPTFPDRFFDGTFSFSGKGNDSLFATVTVQTSVFSDPINPANGDFFGSEDFTGTIQIIGGTGRYLNATGSAEYIAHSEWRPPTNAGTLFSGSTSVTGTGTIAVLARNGQLESQRYH